MACLSMDANNSDVVKTVSIQDELLNDLALSRVFKGGYPGNALVGCYTKKRKDVNEVQGNYALNKLIL